MNDVTNPPTGNAAASQKSQQPKVDFGVDGGNARAQSSKVTSHIKMNFGGNNNAQSNNAGNNGGASGQVNNGNPQYTRTNGGNNFNGRQNNNGNQFKVNDKLTIDFDLLDNMTGQQAAFSATRFGAYLDRLAQQAGVKLDVQFDPEYEAYFIELGKAHICWVTGLANKASASYRLPMMVNNPQMYEMNGNKLTQFAFQPFSGRLNRDTTDEAWCVIYDDDIDNQFNAVAYHISKIAFPNNPNIVPHVTEDAYLNRRNGFNIIDTKTANDAYRKELKEMLKGFFDANNPSSMKTASTDMVAITLTGATKFNQPFDQFGNNGFGGNFGGGFNNGFGGGFGGGFNPGFSSGGFGNNGGFNIGGFGGFGQQMRTKVIAGVKYYIQQDTTPTGQKINVAHITDCVELSNVIVENYLKYIIMYFERLGYANIALDLDLSKITQNLRSTVTKFFMPANQYMFGGSGNFSALSAYVNLDMQIKCRMHPGFINLKTFAGQFPELAKDSKFPKNLNTPEDRVRFEEFKRKAGFIQVLNAGTIKLVYNKQATYYIFNEYNEYCQAALQNMTKDELEAAIKNSQNSNGQNQNGNQNFNNGFNTGFGGFNNGFDGGFGGGFNTGFGNGFGGFGGNGFNGYGGNGFNAGFGGGFGYPGTMGTQSYPVNQGQPTKANGKPVQGNPYINNMNMGGMGMGGFPGMQPAYYNPGAVANGAFPANGASGGSGGYIPQ